MVDKTVKTLVRMDATGQTEAHERSVLYDSRSKTTMDKRPLIGLGRVIQTFVVACDVWTTGRVTACHLRTSRPSVMPTADLFVEYSVSCRNGQQDQVIGTMAPDIAKTGGFSAAVEARISRYVSDFCFGEEQVGNDFLTDFFRLRNKARDALVSRFASETGLSIRLTFELDGEAALRDLRIIPLDTGPFEIRPNDCPANLAIVLRGPLRLVDDHALPAVLQVIKAGEKQPQLQANLARDVTEYATDWVVQKQVGTNRFTRDSFRQLCADLKDCLDQKLVQNHGRRFDHIDLDFSGIDPRPPESFTFCETLPVLVKDTSVMVDVEHSVTMQFNNIACYQAMRRTDSSASNPEAWMKSKIGPIVKEALFGISYADLVLRLDNTKLRNLLVAKAGELGYAINQYVALPQHQITQLRDNGLHLDLDSHEFGTSDNRIKVALSIAVAAWLPEPLDPLERFIRPDIDFTAEVSVLVRDVAQAVLHGISPEQFYTQFNSVESDSDDDADEDTAVSRAQMVTSRPRAVADELRDKIRSGLWQRFRLRSIQVTPKMAESGLTRRYTALCSGVHPLAVSVKPLSDDGKTPELSYDLRYKVSGMAPNGWPVFQANNFSVDDPREERIAIEGLIRATIQEACSLLPVDILEFQHVNAWAQFRHVTDRACDSIARGFGLSITILALTRRASADEALNEFVNTAGRVSRRDTVDHRQQMRRFSYDADFKDLQVVREEQRKLLGVPDDDADVAAFQASKEKLTPDDDAMPYTRSRSASPDSTQQGDVLDHLAALADPARRVAQISDSRHKPQGGKDGKADDRAE